MANEWPKNLIVQNTQTEKACLACGWQGVGEKGKLFKCPACGFEPEQLFK